VSKSTKLPEIRREAFTKAREALGLSVKDLSGMTCFSVRQIEQIENGESSSFYGPQVKVSTAKRVAEVLKLSEEEAFDLGGITAEIKSSEKNIEEDAEAKEVQPSLLDDVKTPQPEAPKKADKKTAKPSLYSPQLSSAGMGFGKQKSRVSPKKKLFLFIVIAAAIAFSVINLRPLFFPEPPKEEEVIIIEEAPQAPAAEPKTDAPTPAAVQEPVTTAPVQAAALECPSPDATPLVYKTEAPKKPGDVVYLQSKTAQTVCVTDASGKSQNKSLEPGVGLSVFGKPPFKVLTAGLTKVDMYYQGAKVRVGNTSAKTIILEQAEIVVQPVTPVETQIRQ
jgi:cytoskeleton protein RodZ